MTTGTIGSFNPHATCYYKTWSGEDGRYMIVGGFPIDKFNAYSMMEISQVNLKDSIYHMFNFTMAEPDNFDSNDSLKLLAKLASKARTHDFHMGKFLAEGKQTINLVTNTIRTVGGALIDLKHGNLSSAARRLGVKRHTSKLDHNDLAGRWLELQFGWLPLLSDVYESAKAFERLTSGPFTDQIYVGTRRTIKGNYSPSPTNWSCWSTVELRQKMTYRFVEPLSAPRQLGLEDPLGVAWEVVPFSFVVDWFVPIGTYLDVLNIVPKLNGYWCKTQTRVVSMPDALCTGGPACGLYYKDCKLVYNRVDVSRTVGSGFKALDIPLPTFKPLGKSLSSLHIYDALALVSQALRA